MRTIIPAIFILCSICQADAQSGCVKPKNLTAGAITSTSAIVNWTKVSGATGYTFQYRIASGKWTGLHVGLSAVDSLNGLLAATAYQVRVATMCSATDSSGFTAASSFTTLAAPTCTPPTTFTVGGITDSSAIISWPKVTGALSYVVQYTASSPGKYTTVPAKGNNDTTTGLTAGSVHKFKVATVCSASDTSAYSAVDSFTTLAAPACTPPSGVKVSGITSESAIISWTPVPGVLGYLVQVTDPESGKYTTAPAKGNNDTTTGLTAGSIHLVKVSTICSVSDTSVYSAVDSFMTLPATCTDNYEPNNTSATASHIGTNLPVTALIGTATDVDWYAFSTATPSLNVKVTLTNLPADYDISLYRASTLALLATSQNTGTTPEEIIFDTAAADNYYVRVSGFNSETLGLYNFSSDNSSATSIANKLTIGALVRGNNNGTTTTLITNVNPSSGYKGASGTYYEEAAAFTGTLNTRTSTYFQFTLTPTAGNVMTLTAISFGAISSGTGPKSYSLRSSLDGYASDITTGTIANTSTWALKTNNGFTVTSAAGTAITFRIYIYAGAGKTIVNTVNIGIDDINLTGSVNAFNSSSCYTLMASTSSTPFLASSFARPGISANAKPDGIILYPVPAHDALTISFNALQTGKAAIQIINELGSLVKNTSVVMIQGANTNKLDLKGLKPGMYMLRIINGENTQTKKFIIVN